MWLSNERDLVPECGICVNDRFGPEISAFLPVLSTPLCIFYCLQYHSC